MTEAEHRHQDGGLTTSQRIERMEALCPLHAARIDHLESWRDELRGAMFLVKFTMGTSILSAALAVIALSSIITGGRS